jgi:hypothetical protein
MIRITLFSTPLDATFNGKFSKDGDSFSGGWRLNSSADESINVPFDMKRA